MKLLILSRQYVRALSALTNIASNNGCCLIMTKTLNEKNKSWPIIKNTLRNKFIPRVGDAKPISTVPLLPEFFSVVKIHVIYWISHLYLTGVTRVQLCQIWMWFIESNRYFCKIENFAYEEINGQSFSNPHPRPNFGHVVPTYAFAPGNLLQRHAIIVCADYQIYFARNNLNTFH